MIETLYSLDALDTSRALFLALLVGFGFGFGLERAGFSSSRRLAGVFYFTDMAVVKVMFTALITAALGLSYLIGFGWLQLDQIYLLPTVYGAQVVGGLLFGVGFVMGGWCPGTAAVGLAAGRIDALVFLLGVVGGSVLFNELFPVIEGLYVAGNQGPQMAYDSVGMSRKPGVVIIDVRPTDYYTGKKSDEARGGHIPGAISRPFTEDLVTASDKVVAFKPTLALAAAYSQIIPAKDSLVIVHCRTGHQASQTYFVLKRLLGYTNVR